MAVDGKGVPVTSIVGLKQGDPLTVVLKDGQVETGGEIMSYADAMKRLEEMADLHLRPEEST